jgi:hypothetical protein
MLKVFTTSKDFTGEDERNQVAALKTWLRCLHTILQILSLSTFERTRIFQLFRDVEESGDGSSSPNQVKLF